ncbi:SRPBCC domain-containing protein [Crocinitomicaceae bacterium]|nr:SRPBCC domain-containing protein [Crocinitomicaceae bacterium]
MVTLKYKIYIEAPREKVWEALWKDENYRNWTEPFTPGSHAVSDWNESDPIQFLDDKNNGMYGIIETKIQNEVMVFKQLGDVLDGIDMERDWAGAREQYFLLERDGTTKVKVSVDVLAEYVDYMNKAFPAALEKLKVLAEN